MERCSQGEGEGNGKKKGDRKAGQRAAWKERKKKRKEGGEGAMCVQVVEKRRGLYLASGDEGGGDRVALLLRVGLAEVERAERTERWRWREQRERKGEQGIECREGERRDGKMQPGRGRGKWEEEGG
ncbi:hypothetical protein MRB53_032334 [Persea americana]|uniref:Uncharacterized protein n=1 Tax=Persea americana TaxID=3435 RepID=A0ACC2KS15_PERAE|nr:hypothetical protein MRB53_032334 [Persea americana]